MSEPLAMECSAPKRRRVLLSAFACSPLWGSEPGVGWHWLMELVQQHEVVLLTHAYFREHLEPALRNANVNVEVHYVQAPAFGMHPHKQLNSRGHYVLWQLQARVQAKRLVSQRSFDLIHHLTWATLRFPCFLGGLGVPLVMGPLGGGERAPLRLLQGLPLKIQALDYVRSASLLWVRVDPLATWGPRRSALVLCKSLESLQALPKSVRARAVLAPEIGSPAVDLSGRVGAPSSNAAATEATAASTAAPVSPQRYRLLFAGRLLGWKGVVLAVGAVRRLLAKGHDVQLDIAGEGPLRAHLGAEIARHGLQDKVRLLGAVPRADLMRLYAQADLFVFPSLHDSSGNVVLEALSRGLPVICLDLGGPQNFVDESCGVVVKTQGLSRDQLEERIADAIAGVLATPGLLLALTGGASAHAARQSWAATVQRSYQAIGARLRWAQA